MFEVVVAIIASVAIGSVYTAYVVAAAIEARDSDKSAQRWSRRRRRAKALRAADDQARRSVEDALARAQVVRDRDPR